MTPSQLAALRQLAEQATPGPWRNGADPSHFDSPEVTDDRTFAYYVTKDNDARFIAALNPTTATALLDRIEELQRENERWMTRYAVEMSAVSDERDSARAEVARLRKIFDDAGKGEHNVLALIEHYQDERMKADDERDATAQELTDVYDAIRYCCGKTCESDVDRRVAEVAAERAKEPK